VHERARPRRRVRRHPPAAISFPPVRAVCAGSGIFSSSSGWLAGSVTARARERGEGRCVRGLHEDHPAVVGPDLVRTVRSGYGWRRENRGGPRACLQTER
jgi:hypothetical protein